MFSFVLSFVFILSLFSIEGNENNESFAARAKHNGCAPSMVRILVVLRYSKKCFCRDTMQLQINWTNFSFPSSSFVLFVFFVFFSGTRKVAKFLAPLLQGNETVLHSLDAGICEKLFTVRRLAISFVFSVPSVPFNVRFQWRSLTVNAAVLCVCTVRSRGRAKIGKIRDARELPVL